MKAMLHPSERDFPALTPTRRYIAAGQPCHCLGGGGGASGVGNSAASTSVTTNNLAAQNEAQVQMGDGTQAKDNAIAVTGNGHLNLGAEIGANSTVNVGTSAGELRSLLGEITQASNDQIAMILAGKTAQNSAKTPDTSSPVNWPAIGAVAAVGAVGLYLINKGK